MFVRAGLFGAFMLTVLLLSAGRWAAWQCWAYSVTLALCVGTVQTLLARHSPELLEERDAPPSDRDRSSRLIAIPLMLGHLISAGLDVGRYHWSPIPLPLTLLGLMLLLAAMALVGWTQLTNPFASSAVRIQAERDQQVISTGPYAFVRHPMYLGVLLFVLGSPLALGSWVSAPFVLPMLAVFVRRTLFEDRMLHDELKGYREYAARVRWRVVPGVF